MELASFDIDALGTRLQELKGESPCQPTVPLDPALLEPLTAVRLDGRLELIDGFKRLALLKAQGIRQTPVRVVNTDLKQSKALMLALNARRRTITLWEEARLVEDLVQTEHMTPAAVGRLLGRRDAWVQRRLGFIRGLDEAIRPFVQASQLGPQSAYQLSRLPPELQMPLFLSIHRQKLSVRQIESAVALMRAADAVCARAIALEPLSHLAQADVQAAVRKQVQADSLSHRLDTAGAAIRAWREKPAGERHESCETDVRVLQAACKRL